MEESSNGIYDVGSDNDDNAGDIGDVMAEMEDEPDLEHESVAEGAEGGRSVVGRLRSLQSVSIFVQVGGSNQVLELTYYVG